MADIIIEKLKNIRSQIRGDERFIDAIVYEIENHFSYLKILFRLLFDLLFAFIVLFYVVMRLITRNFLAFTIILAISLIYRIFIFFFFFMSTQK